MANKLRLVVCCSVLVLLACDPGAKTASPPSESKDVASTASSVGLSEEQIVALIDELAAKPGQSKSVLLSAASRIQLDRWEPTDKAPPAGAPQQWLLGKMYDHGVGRSPSGAAAMQLIGMACDSDYGPACFTIAMANLQADQKSEARALLVKAANAGYVPAMNNLGFMLAVGDGVAIDRTTAIHWLTKAAEAGNAAAMGNLGSVYLKGDETEDAIKWLSAAAEAGEVRSTNLLGMALVKRNRSGDSKRARDAFERASTAGLGDATFNLAAIYEDGWGVDKDPERAAKLREQAHVQGTSFYPDAVIDGTLPPAAN